MLRLQSSSYLRFQPRRKELEQAGGAKQVTKPRLTLKNKKDYARSLWRLGCRDVARLLWRLRVLVLGRPNYWRWWDLGRG